MNNKRKYKLLKKIIKICAAILAVLIMIVSVAVISLQNKKIQTYVAKKITNQLSQTLNTKIEISGVKFQFFNNLVLNDLIVFDRQNDTLIYSQILSAKIIFFKPFDKKIFFNKISLNEPNIHVLKTDTSHYNFDFLIKKRNVKTSNKWSFNCSNFVVKNGKFSYTEFDRKQQTYGINFKDITLDHLNAKIQSFSLLDNGFKFSCSSLDFIDKSGFKVINFKSKIIASNNQLIFTDLGLNTTTSNLNATILSFQYNNIKDFKRFSYKVKFESQLKPSTVDFADISYFVTNVKNMKMVYRLSGNFSGKFNDLKGKNIRLQYGNYTRFQGNINIKGLPDINSSFFFIDVKSLKSNTLDIEKFPIPSSDTINNLSLPSYIKKLDTFWYSGKLTGFIRDFVVYGKFKTLLGNLNSDLRLEIKSDNQVNLNGKVKTKNFDLGTFINANNTIGKVIGNAEIKGFIQNDNNLELAISGKLSKMEVNNYNLHNIDLKGNVYRNKFDGSVTINDPNLDFDFFGRIDFTEKLPEFDFIADIKNAKLDKLNLYQTKKEPDLSLSIAANFKGVSIDDLKGRLDIYNAVYTQLDDTVKMDKLTIVSNAAGNEKEFTLNSDFVNVKLFGKYNFIALVDILTNLGNILLPSYTNQPIYRNEKYLNDFNFKVEITNIEPITRIFLPEISFSPNTHFGGYYNSDNRYFESVINTYEFKYNKQSFNNLELKSKIENEKLDVTLNCNSLHLTQNRFIENVFIQSSVYNDTISLNTQWDNKKDNLFKGNITAYCYFSRNEYNNLNTWIQLQPSEIVINDTAWNIDKAQFHFDSTAIEIFNFKTWHQNQMAYIEGKISKSKTDSLTAICKDLNLSVFNMITEPIGIKLGGTLNGKSVINAFYTDKQITTKLNFENAELNSEPLGNMTILSNWDKNEKKLRIHATANRENINTIHLDGNYFPEGNSLDFDLVLNKLHINILQPYLKSVASNIRGIASGSIKLSGTPFKPVLYGMLKAQKVAFKIDYLNTQYNFSDFIELSENSIKFKNIQLFDEKGNTAVVNGAVNHKYFRDYSYDFDIEANNTLMLNTGEKDNNLYFGTAYGTGLIKIFGDQVITTMDISVKTDQNTVLYIPLTNSEIAEQKQYISFIGSNSQSKKIEKELNVDLSGINLNFDLEVTPDAQIQIIFDSKVGDVIKGRGNAELNMKINSSGDFNMYGDYMIEKGDYLFTLQNVINKKFEIEKGGTISWNGDPYNADLNLDAIYALKKVAIMDLIPDERYQQSRYPVNCKLNMTEKLMNPVIDFQIEIPPPSTSETEYINSIIEGFPEEETNKQLLSLLVLNRFQPYFQFNQESAPIIADINDAKRSATELLSNQLSHWLSQISDNVDLGFTVDPGDEISSQQYEIALSTQLLNNRLTIDTNVGIKGQSNTTTPNQQNNNVVGDVILGIKLNKSGKLRMAVYNKANTNYYEYETAPYTQGIGIFYQEEFNRFSEIFNKDRDKTN